MKKVLCLALVLVFLLAVSISVSAEDAQTDWATYDWNSVDWDTFDRSQIQLGSEALQSLEKWLAEEASFSKFFEYGRHTDGWEATKFSICSYERFFADPEDFLIALAQVEEGYFKEWILIALFHELPPSKNDKVISTFEGIQLSEEENPEAVALMLELIEIWEEKLNISIEIPKTGDPLLLIVALALFSGSGLGVLLKKKKE